MCRKRERHHPGKKFNFRIVFVYFAGRVFEAVLQCDRVHASPPWPPAHNNVPLPPPRTVPFPAWHGSHAHDREKGGGKKITNDFPSFSHIPFPPLPWFGVPFTDPQCRGPANELLLTSPMPTNSKGLAASKSVCRAADVSSKHCARLPSSLLILVDANYCTLRPASSAVVCLFASETRRS